jgi:L-methionine (R)-S-oxide reductase
MAEDLIITASGKEDKYRELLVWIKGLVNSETDLIANMANISAAIKTTFDFLWVGFYLVKDQELVLGPFQGPVACTRITKGRGVCGASWERAEPIIVPDVERFPGHIACSSLSMSEIVIPFFNDLREVAGVLDVDSETYDTFDKTDEVYLRQIVDLLIINA